MNKKTLIILFILYILTCGLLYFWAGSHKNPNDDLLFNKLDSLELKLEELSDKKDSIKTVIITVDKEIINNEKHYEKVVNDIIHQPSPDDSIFAAEYIQKFIDERLR